MAQQAKFEGVKGYATYARALKHGNEVFGVNTEDFRWVVIALESGRFTPCVIYNNQAPGLSGYAHVHNICVVS